jgi:hypothetical protein
VAEVARDDAKKSTGKAEAAATQADKAKEAAVVASDDAEGSARQAKVAAMEARHSATVAESAAATVKKVATDFAGNARETYDAMHALRATNLSFQPAELRARIKIRVVDGVGKCELVEFDLRTASKRPELIVLNSKPQPKSLQPPTLALFTVRLFEKGDRCVGEAKRAYNIEFKRVEAGTADGSLDRSQAQIAFEKRFDDLSGEIELMLRCNERVKKQEVHQLELRGYVQFELPKRAGGESGTLGPVEEVENGIAVSLEYVP